MIVACRLRHHWYMSALQDAYGIGGVIAVWPPHDTSNRLVVMCEQDDLPCHASRIEAVPPSVRDEEAHECRLAVQSGLIVPFFLRDVSSLQIISSNVNGIRRERRSHDQRNVGEIGIDYSKIFQVNKRLSHR